MNFKKNVVTKDYVFVSARGKGEITINAESEAAARMKLPIHKRRYLLKETVNKKGEKNKNDTLSEVSGIDKVLP